MIARSKMIASSSFNQGPSRAKTILRWVQLFFLGIGLLALGYYGYVFVEARVFQAYQSWRLDQLQQGKPATVKRFVKLWIPFAWMEDATPGQSTQAGRPGLSGEPAPGGSLTAPQSSGHSALDGLAGSTSQRQTRRAHILNGSLLGRIEIPRINLSAMIMEGTESSTLQLAVGHLPGTPLPGDPGNVDLAAHRDTFFRGLRKVHTGDLITMSTVSGDLFRYRVDSTAVVLPDDMEALKGSNGAGINLITCYPFNFIGKAPKRFVVHAGQITDSSIPGNLSSNELGSSELSSTGMSSSEASLVSLHVSPADSPRNVHTASSRRRPAWRAQPAPAEASPRTTTRWHSFSRRPESRAEKHPERSGGHLQKSPPYRLRAFFRKLFKGNSGAQSSSN